MVSGKMSATECLQSREHGDVLGGAQGRLTRASQNTLTGLLLLRLPQDLKARSSPHTPPPICWQVKATAQHPKSWRPIKVSFLQVSTPAPQQRFFSYFYQCMFFCFIFTNTLWHRTPNINKIDKTGSALVEMGGPRNWPDAAVGPTPSARVSGVSEEPSPSALELQQARESSVTADVL